MRLYLKLWIIVIALIVLAIQAVRSETPEEWVALGTRIYGGFGTFIPVGIRIGEDALHRLGAERRGITVAYSSGAEAPCPCIADGIPITTEASVGQGTLLSPKLPAGK